MVERDEEAARPVHQWLMTEGIDGWTMRIPRPGEPIDIELNWESRHHQARIEQQFGSAVSITVLPKETPG